MKVLVLGSGGREHAIYLKLKQSPLISGLYSAPGNAGFDADSRFPDIKVDDFAAIEALVKKLGIGVLVVGPETPLALGIKDYFARQMPALLVFGPDQNGAQLEASKVFSNQFIEEEKLPSPRSQTAHNLAEALALLPTFPLPLVIKADGLAAGKGVSIHGDYESARQTLQQIFDDKIFGQSGERVLLQQFMTGSEASLFAICNGEDAIYLPGARDYKAAYDGHSGPNTGGMGSFCPGDVLTPAHIDFVHEKIVKAVLRRFRYTGILYVGLMVHSAAADDLSIVEFNCRLGDPETQSVLPMLETDLFPYILWACGQSLAVPRLKVENHFQVPQKPGATVNVVVVARDYPADYEKGIPLHLPAKLPANVHLVHAGTVLKQEQLVSAGGRIFSVVAHGKSRSEAAAAVYQVLEQIRQDNDFTRLRFRSDIGSL